MVVVAPATEQSGVGHSITYLTPLIVKEVFRTDDAAGGDRPLGFCRGRQPGRLRENRHPAIFPRRPDLVVSGINGGLNAGINVLYSGTVAAAIEGAFFGITSVAVSLEFDEHARYDRAARLARQIIAQILAQKGPEPQLYNLNIPTAALEGRPEVCVVPMNVVRYEDHFQKRLDPWGREYFWLVGGPSPPAARQRDRPFGPRRGQSHDHALGLQSDAPSGVGGNGPLGSSACPSRPTTTRPPRRIRFRPTVHIQHKKRRVSDE